MKTRRLTFAVIVAILALAAILWSSIRSRNAITEIRRLKTLDTNVETEGVQPPHRSIPSPPQVVTKTREAIDHLHKLEKAKDEWRTPIQFFGKVIDENSSPVADTDVHFVWTDLSRNGTSEKATKTDSQGLFRLNGVKGKHLTVHVTNRSYYASKSNETSFSYAGENVNFVADPAKPVVFRLQTKRACEPLVHVQFPGFAKGFRLTNGMPVEIDLLKGKVAPPGQGHFRFELNLSNAQAAREGRPFDWSFSVRALGGGLLESTNEFDFVAPESGYSPTYQTTSSSTQIWTLEKNFFFLLSKGLYGRVAVRLMTGNGVFRLESFINPSGSRNLEYDPAVQPRPTFFE